MFQDMPMDLPIHVKVHLDGRVFKPQSVTLTAAQPNNWLHFESDRNQRIFKLQSTPTGASVHFNLLPLPEKTPVTLPPISQGATATVSLSKAGFISREMIITNTADTTTVAHVQLERSRQIVIRTSPPGADIYIAGEHRGISPTQMLELPSKSSFALRAELSGYRPKLGQFELTGHKGTYLDIELSAAALDRDSLSDTQRRKLRRVENRVKKTRRALKQTRVHFRKAEAELHKQQREAVSNVAKIAATFKIAEKLRHRIQDLEEELQDALSARDSYHEQLIAKDKKLSP